MTFLFRKQLGGDFLQRPAYYAAYLSNVYAYSLSFKTKRIARFLSYTTNEKCRDHSSTLKALQLTACLVPSGWLAKNKKQKEKKLLICFSCRFFSTQSRE
jgi:hypothetical protein